MALTSYDTLPLIIVFGLGASVGGPVSGWIADRFSWPWAFYVQVRSSIKDLTHRVGLRLMICNTATIPPAIYQRHLRLLAGLNYVEVTVRIMEGSPRL